MPVIFKIWCLSKKELSKKVFYIPHNKKKYSLSEDVKNEHCEYCLGFKYVKCLYCYHEFNTKSTVVCNNCKGVGRVKCNMCCGDGLSCRTH